MSARRPGEPSARAAHEHLERSRDPLRGREDAIVLAALAVSAALHAALIAGFTHRRPPGPAPARVAIELEIRELHRERQAATSVPGGEDSAAPAPPRGAAPIRPRVRRPKVAAAPKHGTAAWFEAEGLERRVSPSPAHDGLRPRLQPGLADSKGEEAPVPSDEPAEVKRRVQEALGEVRAAERARTPDRELGDMQAALADGFAAPWSAAEGGAGPAVSSTLAQVADAYARTAEQYGRTGGLSGENAYAREIVALVRVTSAQGGTIEIALAASSGHRAYDRLALARAREAATTGAVADAMRKHRRTIWAFVTRFEIVPPMPGVGCGLDALFHLDLGRCVYPLKKLPPVSRVELRGVE